MATTVRELVTRLGFKVDKGSANRAEKSIVNIKKVAGALAAVFVTGAVAKAINNVVQETIRLGDTIDKTSQKLGINTQALQELRFAAEQTGVQQRTFDLALQRFTRRAAEAARGTGEAKDALMQLGISLRDSRGQLRPVEDLLGDVADAMAKTTNDGDRLRLAFKLFDSEGAALVNTLKGGRDALEDLRRKARETGGVMDDDLIKQSVELTDVQSELNLVFRGVRNIISKGLIPAFLKVSKGVIAWFKANRELVGQGIDRFFEVMGRQLRFIGSVIGAVVDFFIALAKAVRRWFDNLGIVAKVITGIILVAGILAAILLSPLAVIIAIGLAVLAVIDDFQTWREGGKSVIGDLIALFKNLMKTVTEFASELLGKATDVINQWIEFGPSIGEALAEALGFWLKFFGFIDGSVDDFVANLTQTLSSFWENVIDFWGGLFDQFIDGVLGRFTGLGEMIAGFFGFKTGRPAGGGAASVVSGAAAIATGPARALAGVAATGTIPGAPTAAGGAGRRGGAVISNTTSFAIDIQAAPGMSEERLAEMVATKVTEATNETMRMSIEDFGIAPAGA